MVRRAAWRYIASDYKHMPSPDEIARIDWLWEANVMRYVEWIDLLEEPYKRNKQKS